MRIRQIHSRRGSVLWHGLRGSERLTELAQFGIIQIRHGPERHAVADPVMNMESSNRLDGGAGERVLRARRDEHVDRVLAAFIDERRDRPPAQVIETASDKWKADRGEIDNRWREIELAQKPRLHRVLIRRRHVEQMIGHQRSYVTVDSGLGDRVATRGW